MKTWKETEEITHKTNYIVDGGKAATATYVAT